jgi:hypothetical protein
MWHGGGNQKDLKTQEQALSRNNITNATRLVHVSKPPTIIQTYTQSVITRQISTGTTISSRSVENIPP